MKEEFEKKFSMQLKKNKKRVVKAIFGRTILLLSSVFIQFLLLFLFTSFLTDYIWFYYSAGIFSALLLIIHITNSNVNPAYKVAWITPIALIPVFGSFFYLFVHLQPGTIKMEKRLNELVKETRPYLIQDNDIYNQINSEEKELIGIVNYMNEFGGFPIVKNTHAEYFPLGEDKFDSMITELKKARNFIFMEYFIVEDGFMWRTILDILKEKVKEGVEVRFMYDGMCTLSNVPPNFPKMISRFGIQCKVFAPIRPVLTTSQNHRDHRKILVIDGNTAYTGGINLADEYVNLKSRFGHWKDTAVMIKGEGVNSFTLMFLQNWNITERKKDNYVQYLSKDFSIETYDGYIMPYGDSPYDHENVGKTVYIDIINKAQKYIHIMTPYLILDNEMLSALIYARKRGVDVQIICPRIADKLSAKLIARIYYEKLINNNITILEYQPGFVHGKIMTSDGIRGVVGTINMDFRSLYLNFECGAFFYKCDVIKDIEEDFKDTLGKCQVIDKENCRNYSRIKFAIGKFLGIFGPLM